ncbi:MAG: hypothetical protein LBI17_02500 [Rickettsiales bacterium]|nr:hypothetical protein [Rickettsiales bacterium]
MRSVARPAQVFYAPFRLVLANLVLNVCLMALLLLFGLGGYIWISIIGFILAHMALILIGRWEPHIDSMLAARGNAQAKTKNMIRENGNKFSP